MSLLNTYTYISSQLYVFKPTDFPMYLNIITCRSAVVVQDVLSTIQIHSPIKFFQQESDRSAHRMSPDICMVVDFGPATSERAQFRKEISSSDSTLWEFLIMKHHEVILPFAPKYFLMSVLVNSPANATAH